MSVPQDPARRSNQSMKLTNQRKSERPMSRFATVKFRIATPPCEQSWDGNRESEEKTEQLLDESPVGCNISSVVCRERPKTIVARRFEIPENHSARVMV